MLFRGALGGGAASGKVGAMVASHNKGGQYLRARTTPTNPRTSLQNAIRGAFTQVASMWQTLSDSARAAWNNWGTVTGTTNRLGDRVPISGMAAFQRANTIRIQAGRAIVLDAPPAPLAQAPHGDTSVTFAYGNTNGTITLVGDGFPIDNDTNGFFATYLSPPFSLGRSSAPGNTRLAVVIPGNASASAHVFALPWSISGSSNQMEATVNYQSAVGLSAGPFRVTSPHV